MFFFYFDYNYKEINQMVPLFFIFDQNEKTMLHTMSLAFFLFVNNYDYISKTEWFFSFLNINIISVNHSFYFYFDYNCKEIH